MTQQEQTLQAQLARIREKTARLKAQESRILSQAKQSERKNDTRRKVLIGAMILEFVKAGQWPEKELKEQLDEFLSRTQDRALFGLPPAKFAQSASEDPLAKDPQDLPSA